MNKSSASYNNDDIKCSLKSTTLRSNPSWIIPGRYDGLLTSPITKSNNI